MTTVFVLPIVALAALTTGFTQLLVSIFALVLVVAGWNMAASHLGASADWLALEWVRSDSIGAIVAVASLLIILRQYRHRETASARLVAGGALLLVFLVLAFFPWQMAFALQSYLVTPSVETSSIRIGFDPNMSWGARAFISQDDRVDLQIPLRVSGVPGGTKLQSEGIVAVIEGPEGDTWRTGNHPRSHVRSTGDITSFHAAVDSAFYKRVKERPVRIRGSLYFTLYGNPRHAVLPIRKRPELVPTPGMGLCAAVRTGRGVVLHCRSAFRSLPHTVTLDLVGPQRFVLGAPPMSFLTLSSSRPISYSPFPAEADLVPVSQSMQTAEIHGAVSVVATVALEPVAHVVKDFEITGLRLADFEVR